MTREILTLQFGNYANYIGTHWWNIQESSFNYDATRGASEINHDVFYREGVNSNHHTTYTPRLLLVDLDGALKHLPKEGELYGNTIKRASQDDADKAIKKLKEDLDWKNSDVELIEQPAAVKHEFQTDLENTDVNIHNKDYNLAQNVDSWVDFSYARFHPRTVHVVKQFKHDNDKQTFDTFSNGAQLWQTLQFKEEFSNNIRQYIEECDFLQGFQTIFDSFNGFAGLAANCLEHLSEEYGKAIFGIPVYMPSAMLYENADETMSDSIRVVNSLFSFNALIEQTSLFVPLSTAKRVWRQIDTSSQLPNLHYMSDNNYQTASILASYLDTISLRYRLRESNCSLSGFCGDLNRWGRKMVAGAIALPLAISKNQYLIDYLDQLSTPLLTSITPNCSVGNAYVVQALCVRGLREEQLKRPLQQAQKQMQMAAYKCNSVSEMFQLYMQCNYHNSMSHVTSTSMPMSLSLPFPVEMFDARLDENGFLGLNARNPEQKLVSVPTLASAQSSNDLGDMLETLHRDAKRIKTAKLHRFKVAGMEDEDYADALENILRFKDNYDDNMEL